MLKDFVDADYEAKVKNEDVSILQFQLLGVALVRFKTYNGKTFR